MMGTRSSPATLESTNPNAWIVLSRMSRTLSLESFDCISGSLSARRAAGLFDLGHQTLPAAGFANGRAKPSDVSTQIERTNSGFALLE
jgi:hypothetical protein